MTENSRFNITLTLPLIEQLKQYTKAEFAGDATAGVVVAIMLVPQAMAYALLADLPPEVGLYTSILPLIVYGLTGSAGMLAVGPTAIISLMTGEALGLFNGVTDAEKLGIALTLTLLIGLLMLIMGALKMGRVVNFLSHPVLSGFASAAAVVIALSQLKHVLGLPIPRGLLPHQILIFAVREISSINLMTLAIGVGSLAILLLFKFQVRSLLDRRGVKPFAATVIVRLAPLVMLNRIPWAPSMVTSSSEEETAL